MPWCTTFLVLLPFLSFIGLRRRESRRAHAEPVAPPAAERTTGIVAALVQDGPTLLTGSAVVCRVELVLADGSRAAVRRAVATDLLAHVAPGSTAALWRDGAGGAWQLDLAVTRAAATGVDPLAPIDASRTSDGVFLSPEEEAIPGAVACEAVVHAVVYDGLEADTSQGRRRSIALGLAVVGGAPDVVSSQRVRLHELVAFPLGALVPVRVAPGDPLRVVADAPGAVARLAAAIPRPLPVPPGRAAAPVERLAWRGGHRAVRFPMRVRVAVGADRHDLDLPLHLPDLLLVLPGPPVLVRIGDGRVELDLAATAQARADAALAGAAAPVRRTA